MSSPLLGIIAICFLIYAPLVGSISIPIESLWSGELSQIFWSVRLPRVLMAFFVGGLLAVCGAVYQAIFKNPLASPYTLGVSSGAALGCTFGMVCFGGAFALGYGSVMFGVVGSLSTILLVSWLSRSMKGDINARLLLSGVVLSFFLSSIILFLQYLGDFTQIFRVSRWLMGSVETVGYESLIVIAVISVSALICLVLKSEELTVLGVGSEFATTKGIETDQLIKTLFVITSLGIGVVVSFCGPIGFVGIAVPYVIRSLGAGHFRGQLFQSYLLGGVLLTACDTLGRTIIAPAEIPVGVITALFAAPLVMVLLVRGAPSTKVF